MKRWYAVQETREDALDYGSYDYEEAYEMAKEIANEKGESIIAYIDEDAGGYCDEEEWVYADEDDETDYTEVYPQ